ncbi:hypothetical protein H8356DRAFT_1333404 [Neocallimastix lanati (nom. inval.)]|nr:hypothetical protein H8356DRAFT_1333404 [Neocallimastix sp. JGI-2020a]
MDLRYLLSLTNFIAGVSGYNKVLPCHTISASTLSVTDYRTTRFGDDGYGKPQPHTH